MKSNYIPQHKRTPTEEREYCFKAATRIIMLLGPVKDLSISRLNNLKSPQLEQIGKAARELSEVLAGSGIVARPKKSA